MKNTLLTILVTAIINLSFGGFAYSQTTKTTQKTTKIKSQVTKIGVDSKTVIVKLYDGSKIKGKITEINEENFLIDTKPISYADVKGLSKRTPPWIAVVGIASLIGSVALLACAAKECGGLR